ncbi:MAG: hypothetical protein ACE5DQ_02910, partial [Candidatus Paceibacterota bacterium]
ELLWGRYVVEGSVTEKLGDEVQKILDTYVLLYNSARKEGAIRNQDGLFDYITDLASCEIEESMNKKLTLQREAFLYYVFQTTHQKVSIEAVYKDTKDQYYFVACEKIYLKNDPVFLRFHLFVHKYDKLASLSDTHIKQLARNFKKTFQEIEATVNNPHHDLLGRFVKKLLPPYLVLFELMRSSSIDTQSLLKDKDQLQDEVGRVCNEKYKETAQKLHSAGLRSIIYIFLTKMIFVLILEFPLSKFIYGQVDLIPLTINTLSPPVLMGLIVTFTNPPRDTNTQRIYERIVQIIDTDPSYELDQTLSVKKKKQHKRPALFALFSVMYLIVFLLTFVFIFQVLEELDFNLISKAIFVFFMSVVTFFGYKVRQISKEYALSVKESIISPFIDTFFLPILSVGKILSNELAKLNILMFVFDVLIEAPFKLIIEVLEEWVSFTKSRKEEIA